MRHNVAGFKLGRDTEHRKAMWRNMAIALFTHGQITTTVPKAKSLRPMVEKIISLAKKGDLTARRRVLQQLGNPITIKFDEDPDVQRNRFGEIVGGPRLVKRIFDEIGPRYADRTGGYTRIVRTGKYRIGDASDLCVIQLVGDESGPQVSGQYSRRREKADKRMAFAAKLRKGSSTAPPETPEVSDTATSAAPVTEAPATGDAAGETTAEA